MAWELKFEVRQLLKFPLSLVLIELRLSGSLNIIHFADCSALRWKREGPFKIIHYKPITIYGFYIGSDIPFYFITWSMLHKWWILPVNSVPWWNINQNTHLYIFGCCCSKKNGLKKSATIRGQVYIVMVWIVIR